MKLPEEEEGKRKRRGKKGKKNRKGFSFRIV